MLLQFPVSQLPYPGGGAKEVATLEIVLRIQSNVTHLLEQASHRAHAQCGLAHSSRCN